MSIFRESDLNPEDIEDGFQDFDPSTYVENKFDDPNLTLAIRELQRQSDDELAA